MSLTDATLLIGGIIIPTIMLVAYAATVAVVLIFVGWFLYYKWYKAHMLNTHPDKLLLEEIRRQY